MPKPTLTKAQYILELNRCLQQHELYRKGMAFVPYPEGASDLEMSGYSITGPFELTHVYSQVAHQVDGQYDIRD